MWISKAAKETEEGLLHLHCKPVKEEYCEIGWQPNVGNAIGKFVCCISSILFCFVIVKSLRKVPMCIRIQNRIINHLEIAIIAKEIWFFCSVLCTRQKTKVMRGKSEACQKRTIMYQQALSKFGVVDPVKRQRHTSFKDETFGEPWQCRFTPP